MTAFKNTGRAAHSLPKNIKQKRAFQRAGPKFNTKIDGIEKNKQPSFRALGPRKSPNKSTGKVYSPGIVLGYKRSLKRQHPNRALVEIIGCKTKEDAKFYLGKRVLYVYRAPSESGTRTLMGKVTRCHGNSGVVQVKFARNISSTAFGKRCRVLLYPATN